MAVTEGKKKKPPTFQYLPKNRAKRLKKSWVEDHKIRSKWKAQKRREGLTSQTSVLQEDPSAHDETSTGAKSDSSHPNESSTPKPSHDRQSLRDLRKFAYASKPSQSQSSESSHSKIPCGGKATVRREMGQPNMKLRMNVLLEQIKRDFS